ncbi:NADPH-dependent FMN reductase [Streptomyces smyrnaeus]|uniref:NADPH-dependent FMN reductase n=1 Tax=Streptomyces smyrnaeus TaxID=1387713 RepID=UPI003789D681
MTSILAVSGSPSAFSRTAAAVDQVARRLAHGGHDVAHLAVRDLPAADLLAGRAATSSVRDAIADVAAADGLIVATPVYKASYTGLLKAFLDLLPQAGLADKAVLPLATGGTLAHMLTIDYALRPVLSALDARHVTAGCFVLDSALERLPDHTVRVAPEAEPRLLQAADSFAQALTGAVPAVSALP